MGRKGSILTGTASSIPGAFSRTVPVCRIRVLLCDLARSFSFALVNRACSRRTVMISGSSATIIRSSFRDPIGGFFLSAIRKIVSCEILRNMEVVPKVSEEDIVRETIVLVMKKEGVREFREQPGLYPLLLVHKDRFPHYVIYRHSTSAERAL